MILLHIYNIYSLLVVSNTDQTRILMFVINVRQEIQNNHGWSVTIHNKDIEFIVHYKKIHWYLFLFQSIHNDNKNVRIIILQHMTVKTSLFCPTMSAVLVCAYIVQPHFLLSTEIHKSAQFTVNMFKPSLDPSNISRKGFSFQICR